jgi:SAM-dependent methyltransferase
MQHPNSIERRFAEFYRLYCQGFRRDIPVYQELAAKHDGPVLEVGCRTGRVAAHLGSAGRQVTAVDTARPMLELAVEHVRPWAERVRVADVDLRHQPLAERFPVVLVTLFAFNDLIDVEEQRVFLRHVRRCLASPGVLAVDLFCPLFLARPDDVGEWREIDREVGGKQLHLRDKREMLTPLLEKRTQEFSIEDGPTGEHTSHRRYIPPQQAAALMAEAGLDNVQWIRDYDLTTLGPVEDDARVSGPFMVLGQS